MIALRLRAAARLLPESVVPPTTDPQFIPPFTAAVHGPVPRTRGRQFIIERTVPGAGDMSPEELSALAEQSNATVASLGVPYHWHESFAAGDTIDCVHSADSAETIVEHSRRAGFPVDKVTPVGGTFGPESAGA